MSKAILVLDMPDTCFDCFFSGNPQEVSVGNGLYKKVSRCLLAQDIEDPWRNIDWQFDNKEDWCPFKPVPEKMEGDDSIKYQWGNYEDGWNHCIDEILGEV